MSYKPHKPAQRRPCTRYSAGGMKCSNTTTRLDGWCGLCKGFQTPGPRQRPDIPPKPEASRNLPTHTWRKSPMPLSPEEAYDISITKTARENFIRRHGGTMGEAEAQIRSLLEDLIREGVCFRSEQTGYYKLQFPKATYKFYYLRLGKDAESVVGYSTLHNERTYAQVKAGVRSRTKSRDRRKGIVAEAASAHYAEKLESPVQMTNAVISMFVKKVANASISRATIGDLLHDLDAYVDDHVLPRIPEEITPDTSSVVSDSLGWNWVVVMESDGTKKLIGIHPTPSEQ